MTHSLHSSTAATHGELGRRAASLLVFADDWGRHPSSCQHLVSQLLPHYPTWWVNTIGMRRPRLDHKTLQRGWEKLGPWLRGQKKRHIWPRNLHVIDPKMWPWFSRRHDRWLNRRLLLRTLRPLVAQMHHPVVGITTLPIVAEIMSSLPCQQWVYYCVDDFSQWPGLDQWTLARLERKLIAQADCLITASETLQARIAAQGRTSHLLTHGVDLGHWQAAASTDSATSKSELWENLPRPLVVFWGLIDRRMDCEFVASLSKQMAAGTIILAGPVESPDPRLLQLPRVVHLPPLDYARLPELAAAASVLVMPYIDAPVTRAMQPLKLKEYLATGKPVVGRDLPAVRPWADCLDAVDSPAAFATAVCARLDHGLDESQRAARRRLADESWAAKARQFEAAALQFAPMQTE